MELLIALVAIVGTLAGAVVTKLLDKTDEGGRWVRDHRSDSYVEFVRQFQAMRQILRQIALLDRTAEEWRSVRARRRQHWEKYNAALVEIELFGTVDAYRAALDVDRALRALSACVTDQSLTVPQWHAQRSATDAAMRAFVDASRAEWKLKPLGGRSAWVTGRPSNLEHDASAS